ncbi:MAG: hypothetical protein ACOYT4_03535 [Nanoarchaeota archaeon]
MENKTIEVKTLEIFLKEAELESDKFLPIYTLGRWHKFSFYNPQEASEGLNEGNTWSKVVSQTEYYLSDSNVPFREVDEKVINPFFYENRDSVVHYAEKLEKIYPTDSKTALWIPGCICCIWGEDGENRYMALSEKYENIGIVAPLENYERQSWALHPSNIAHFKQNYPKTNLSLIIAPQLSEKFYMGGQDGK